MNVKKLAAKAGKLVRESTPARWFASTPNPTLAQALGPWSGSFSDIHDHLGTIFFEAVAARPRLIVELGTRGGVSTRALLAAAEASGAQVLSVDIEDCGSIDLPVHLRAKWTFIQADDVDFSMRPFEQFCSSRGWPAQADVILLDTSHKYEHTLAELRCWVPRLATPGVMLLHDTNMGNGWYRCLSGKVKTHANRTRDVIQALEEFLGRHYDETTYFSDLVGQFAISHVPWSSGLTVVRKLASA